MKVAIVSRGLPDSLNLMNGIFELDQAKALAAAGVDVKLLVVDLRSIRRWRPFGVSHETREGVDCYIISIPVGNVPHSLFCLIGTFALKRLYTYAYCDGERPDIIHGHFTRQGYMAAKLAKEGNIPLIVTEHSSDMNKGDIDGSLLKIAEEAYSAAKTVIAVGSPLAKSIKKKTGIDSIVIPNIVNTSLFTAGERQSDVHMPFTYVSVGGLIRRKRMDLLINAFSRVHCKYRYTRLVIFGRGEEETKLKAITEEKGLNEFVEFRGLVKREDIAEEFRKANAFVLLSERETFGVAYIEALAAGLPVVATRCQGPEDFMVDEFGYLIDSDNEDQAVQAMESVYERIEEFSPKKISRTINELFSPEAISKQLIEIYEKAVQ